MQVLYLRHLEKTEPFPRFEYSLTERQQQKQVVQTPVNHPTLKAASGKAQRALESLTRLCQPANSDATERTKIMPWGDSLHYCI